MNKRKVVNNANGTLRFGVSLRGITAKRWLELKLQLSMSSDSDLLKFLLTRYVEENPARGGMLEA